MLWPGPQSQVPQEDRAEVTCVPANSIYFTISLNPTVTVPRRCDNFQVTEERTHSKPHSEEGARAASDLDLDSHKPKGGAEATGASPTVTALRCAISTGGQTRLGTVQGTCPGHQVGKLKPRTRIQMGKTPRAPPGMCPHTEKESRSGVHRLYPPHRSLLATQAWHATHEAQLTVTSGGDKDFMGGPAPFLRAERAQAWPGSPCDPGPGECPATRAQATTPTRARQLR